MRRASTGDTQFGRTDQAGRQYIMYKDYLNPDKEDFMLTIIKGTLWPYLADIDRHAEEMYDLVIERIKEAENVTELPRIKTK